MNLKKGESLHSARTQSTEAEDKQIELYKTRCGMKRQALDVQDECRLF